MTKLTMLRIFLTGPEIVYVHNELEKRGLGGTSSDQAAAEILIRHLAEPKPVNDDSCLNDENAGEP